MPAVKRKRLNLMERPVVRRWIEEELVGIHSAAASTKAIFNALGTDATFAHHLYYRYVIGYLEGRLSGLRLGPQEKR